MMKKLFSFACILVLLFSFSASSALADECSHSFVYTDTYRQTWIAADDTHKHISQRQLCCTECGMPAWAQVEVIAAEAAHTLENTKNWHDPDGTHSYVLSCPTCGYSRTETVSCNAAPCRSYDEMLSVTTLLSATSILTALPALLFSLN